ncbi:MAG: undecaprenyldiphospho-muramoylpentapeptide beta-N-acetylglucosaminyltransferase [Ignavibacteria bacterium]|nr:undecaprenyldiphospho-muramoylpentapeptide beta-N-acetylglucosaminyltransferase [Ignavibacteria bacterium]
MKSNNQHKILIAAGGTGGHLFPAIAIAEEIKARMPLVDLLFVGTKKRMEAELLPKLGYNFFGTSIKGLPRKIGLSLISFFLSFIVALVESLFRLFKFKPDVAIGTGSYISVPPLLAAKFFGAKIFLTESNSLPGIATRFLAPLATEIYLTFEQSKKYFKNKSNLFVTGTPVRKSLIQKNREEAARYFNLSKELKTILVLGGSLGARSINEKIRNIYQKLSERYQLIWQTGKRDYDLYKNLDHNERVVILPFIERMDYAYSMCDLLVSRSGASTISEIVTQKISSILIPSPNVTENHQYHNAMELVEQNAAEIHLDNQSSEELYNQIISLLEDENRLTMISRNLDSIAKPDATKTIVDRIIKHLEKSE